MAVLDEGLQRKVTRAHPAFRQADLGARVSKLDTDGTYTGTLGDAVELSVGELVVGQADDVGAAKTLSGDATIDADGVLTISAKAVEAAMIALAEGHLLVGAASGAAAALSARGNGKILIGDGTTLNSVSLSGDATMVNTGALTIAAKAVSVAKLADDVQDLLPTLTLTGSDDADGTGTVSIQVKDAAGNALAGTFLIRTWIGTADDYGADALSDYSVSTGTAKEEVVANAEYLVVTDATGLAVMNIDNAGPGTVYAWAAINGKVLASGAITLTGGE
jgi:hypothetical protein